MRRLTIDDGQLEISFRDVGSGRGVVVLLHGFPFTSEMWTSQLDALADRYRIIAPDFRGFGGSQTSPHSYTLARLADDISELLVSLGIERAVIGGLSMGGYVAFEFYRRHVQQVAGLVLADTRPDPDSAEARANRLRMAALVQAEGVTAVVEQLIPKLLSPETRTERPEVERRLRAMMGSATPSAIAHALEAMASRRDARPLLASVSVPTLVVVGADDQLTPPDESRAWSRAIDGAVFERIDGAGHVSNLERPQTFNARLLAFLDARVTTSDPPSHENRALTGRDG